MGCSPSAYAREDIARFRDVFEALLLGEDDIGRLLKSFNKIDHMKDGTIEMAELLAFLDLEKTPWSRRIFSIFDEDSSGLVDFREFVISVWNYCTLGKSSLPLFAFDLYDTDSSGFICPTEIVTMLKDLYGTLYETSDQARSVRSELDLLLINGTEITVDTFKEFCFNHPALLFRAFQIQEIIRKRVMGISFWKRYSAKRLQISKNKWVPIDEFLHIHMKKGTFESLMIGAGAVEKKGIPTAKAKIALSNSGPLALRKKKHESDNLMSISGHSNCSGNSADSKGTTSASKPDGSGLDSTRKRRTSLSMVDGKIVPTIVGDVAGTSALIISQMQFAEALAQAATLPVKDKGKDRSDHSRRRSMRPSMDKAPLPVQLTPVPVDASPDATTFRTAAVSGTATAKQPTRRRTFGGQ